MTAYLIASHKGYRDGVMRDIATWRENVMRACSIEDRRVAGLVVKYYASLVLCTSQGVSMNEGIFVLFFSICAYVSEGIVPA